MSCDGTEQKSPWDLSFPSFTGRRPVTHWSRSLQRKSKQQKYRAGDTFKSWPAKDSCLPVLEAWGHREVEAHCCRLTVNLLMPQL